MRNLSTTPISMILPIVLALLLSSTSASSEQWLEMISFADNGPEPVAGTTAYHTFDEMVTELVRIATDHPSITDLASIGKTFEGRDIWSMKISDNAAVEEDEPEVIIYGMHHSREWITTEVCLYIINFLTGNYSTNASVQNIVDEREVWIIPMVNPDGRVFDGEDDPTTYADWRKNRVLNWDGSRGVDLNRNYGHLWGGAGANDDPSGETYRGPSPFSENETQAIRDLALQHDFVFSLSYHSYGQIILYPWGNTYNPSDDDELFSAIGWGMSDRMTNKAGSPREQYIPMRGSQLYLTSGDDVDWMYGDLGVLPFVVETYPSFSDSSPAVTNPYNGFHPREDKIVPVCEDNLGGALFLLEIADNPYQVLPHVSVGGTPDRMTIDRGQNLSFQIEVMNDGNVSDTFNLLATGHPGWNVTFSSDMITLPQGSSQMLDMWVEVPGIAPSGELTIYVTALSMSTSGSTSVRVDVPFLNDVGITSILPFAEGQMYPMGNYTIQAEATNHGSLGQNPFEVLMEIYEIGPPTETNIFYEDFESGLSRWTVVDFDGAISQDTWHTVDWNTHGGLNAVWAGYDVTGFYSDMTLQMLESPSFDLSEALAANLTFFHILRTEINYDYAVVEVGVDNQWTILRSWSGWVAWLHMPVSFDLTPFVGNEDVKFRFRFSSDEGKVDAGWFIDDVWLNITLPEETLVHGPVVKRIASQLFQGESELVSYKYKFNKGGHFKVLAASILSGDENPSNDSSEVRFSIDPTRYRVFLHAGMNLASYPLMTSNVSSDAILSTIQCPYDRLWKSQGSPGSWSSYSDTKPWSQVTSLNHTDGWWIRVSADTYFDVTGTAPGNVTIFLKAGWNLIGYPTMTDRTVEETFQGLPYDRLECFDPASPYHLKAMNDSDYLTTGMGYWVHATQHTALVINP